MAHFVLFLTCRAIKAEIIATTFITIFTFKKRQQSYYRKKSCIPSELLTAICAIKLSVFKKERKQNYLIVNTFLGYKSFNFKRFRK